jgi:hypothetical protein
MDMVYINGKMGRNMKEIMKMEKNKEMEFFITRLESNTLVIGLMANNKAKEK